MYPSSSPSSSSKSPWVPHRPQPRRTHALRLGPGLSFNHSRRFHHGTNRPRILSPSINTATTTTTFFYGPTTTTTQQQHHHHHHHNSHSHSHPYFSSDSSSITNESTCKVNSSNDPNNDHHKGGGGGLQRSYGLNEMPSFGDFTSNLKIGGGGGAGGLSSSSSSSCSSSSSASASALVRQRSSPAGFLSHLASDN
ncbi:uncharacterized protein LOC136065963, partial [Quercus suber]|uniref:uncharacterized protein LOC136065963 n=1 Tax=Quercus suber TaxID=58331 RepID=UPI0032DE7626